LLFSKNSQWEMNNLVSILKSFLKGVNTAE